MQANQNLKRIEVPFFDGVNALVSENLAKKQEFIHAENVRSVVIGAMDKREGTATVGSGITATANYGVFYFPSSAASNLFLYRVSTVSGTIGIYYLNSSSVWTALTGEGTSLVAGQFKTVVADGKLFMVNYNDQNRYIDTDGTTVVDSATVSGHLYNSPNANCIAFYKNQLYLADFTYSSVRYKTTILRSSLPLGVVALVSGDPESPYTTLYVTDTKYIFSASGANSYDIYRGAQKVAVFTVTTVNQDNLVGTIAFEAGFTEVLSADELWISGTYSGAKKFRWVANPSQSGSPVKEYDTMRLAGGDESEIKMLETVGNVLMIASNSMIGIWDGNVLQSYDLGIGCVSRRGNTKLRGALYFLGYDGVYVTDGSMPKLISSKIEPYITGATKAGKEAAAMGKKGRSILLQIGDVTLYNKDGSTNKTLTDVVLEFNTSNEDWYVHTGISASAFASYVDSSNTDRLIMMVDASPFTVQEFLTGELDGTEAIIMRGDLPPITLVGQVEKFAYPQEVIIESDRGTGIKCFASLDGGPYFELVGEGVKGVTILKFTNQDPDRSTPPRCRKVSLSIRHAQKQLCRIGSLAIVFLPTTEEEEQVERNDGGN